MSAEKLSELGKGLGLQGEGLVKWISEHQELERAERAARREEERMDREARERQRGRQKREAEREAKERGRAGDGEEKVR